MPLPLTPITAFNGVTVPSRADPANYPARGDTWNAQFQPFSDQANTLAGQVNAMADAASGSQVAAAASQSAAASSATAAQTYAASAGTLAGAVMFSAATAYTQGQAAISSLNFRTFRRRTAGTSAIDPASDPTNWAPQSTYANLITTAGTLEEASYVFARDVAVTLPDLTTQKQLSLTIPGNLQSFTSAVSTFDGWTIDMGYSAGVTKTNVPLVFGTPHGWWGSAPMTPPVNHNANFGTGTTLAVGGSVALSASLHIYAFYENSANSVYFVAVNPTTGAMGTAVTPTFSGAANNETYLYPVNATTFIAFNGNRVQAFSVSGVSINVIGTVMTLSNVIVEAPIQLTPSTYLVHTWEATSNLSVVSVSGTTLTQGATVTSGAPGGYEFVRMAPISASAALITYLYGTTGAQILYARVASISGTTITLNATANSSIALVNAGNDISLIAVAQGSSYIFCGLNSNNTSNGTWYGISVSGETVTIGAASVQTSLVLNRYRRTTHIYRWGSSSSSAVGNNRQRFAVVLDSATVLFVNTNGAALYVVSISGTSLTFGSPFTTGTPQAILTDVATGSNVYSVGQTSYSKLTISGTTISAVFTVAGAPQSIHNDDLTNVAFKNGGVWYGWASGPMGSAIVLPISASKFATVSTNNIKVYGNFS
jgi:hypothetical protein